MRKTITIFLISITGILAFATGIADMFEKNDVICATAACMKVHSSSFSTVFETPVGFYAAGVLLLDLWLFLKGKSTLSAILLWGLLGAEAYFTFIQIFFINSLCASCLIFFSLLIACVISSKTLRIKSALVMGFTVFLGSHFVFFFPSVKLKPTLIQNLSKQKTNIEIFASPSCSHCDEAIAELSRVCTDTRAKLIVRPVYISRKDMKKSVKWVSGELFQCGSSTSNRLAEKIVWDNEAEARKLNNGDLQVPLILVRMDGFQEIFQGWDKQVKDNIFKILAKADMEIKAAGASELTHKNKLTNHGAICSKTTECHEEKKDEK
ncbi:MAG: hypothetical protein COX19_12095 [Desulfobacterales bacterium CG23_combo_of_CG06-09_8_20_14_all_51_8]|nr:MAG: hypothetical protein COX19_12095 [Desulfobacterales bacterium CG23_combo_of_CG06-09_8_20_14_all_51_8]